MMLGNKNVTNKEKNNQNNVQNTTHRKLNIEQHKHQGNIPFSRNFVECDPSFNQWLIFYSLIAWNIIAKSDLCKTKDKNKLVL